MQTSRTNFQLHLYLFMVIFSSTVVAQNISIGSGTVTTISTNTFYSTLLVKNGGTLTIKSGATLTVGANGTSGTTQVVDFQNGSVINIETGGTLIINGKLINSNNSDQVTVNGTVTVNGNVDNGNGAAITGTGTFTSTGTVTNSGLLFGSTCNFLNNITSTSTTICAGTSVALSGNQITSSTYQWEVSTTSATTGFANATGTSNAYNYSGTVNAASWYRRKVTSGGCSITSSVIQISVNATGTWIGGTGSWNTAANWCGNAVPTTSSDLIINSGAVTIASSANARNITIGASASLKLNQGIALSVYGHLVNAGTLTADSLSTVTFAGSAAQNITGAGTLRNVTINNTNGVTISTGTANAITVNGLLTLTSGTFKTNNNLTLDFDKGAAILGSGSGTVTDSVTVKRKLAAGWHYIGASLENLNYYDIANNIPLTSFYTYQENNSNPNLNYGWSKRTDNSSTSLIGVKNPGGASAMIGYLISSTTATTLDLTGTYTHGKTFSTGAMSYTSSGSSSADGWHMISNPYPSYLDWGSLTGWVKTGIATSIYYYNPKTGINCEFIPSIAGLPAVSLNGASPFIPPMQAFWIQTTINNASITVNKNAIVSPNQYISFFRKSANAESATPTVKLMAKGSACGDETVVRFSSIATEGFDPEIDAYKFKNDGQCPSLYTTDESNEYGVNTLPAIELNKSTSLNFEAYVSGLYTIDVKELDNIPDGYHLI